MYAKAGTPPKSIKKELLALIYQGFQSIFYLKLMIDKRLQLSFLHLA